MKTQIINGAIEVNGISAVLLDDRAKEGIFVDTEDLIIVSQYSDEDHNGNNIWIDFPNNKFKPESDTRQVVRFKQPDRMEVVWEESEDQINWDRIEQHQVGFKRGMHCRQIFILKDKEGFNGLTKEQLLSETLQLDENGKFETVPVIPPLTKEYSMNEIETPLQILERFLKEEPEEYKLLVKKIEAMDIQGPTFKDYLQCLGGYSPITSVKPILDGEGAKSAKNFVEEYAKDAFTKHEVVKMLIEFSGLHIDEYCDNIINLISNSQSLNPWVNARNDHPVLNDPFETIEVLADTEDYNNYEVVIYDGTDYFDKHRHNDDGNPLAITDKIQRWKYI